MGWKRLPVEDWLEAVDGGIAELDPPAGPSIERFELRQELEGDAAIHEGSLRVEGDLILPSEMTAIMGDLEVGGCISTKGVNGADGNATLVVFGDVRCATLVNDWASLVLVSGDLSVRDWVYANAEDSSMVVGSGFTTPLFIGSDIWIAVGNDARMDAGLGYAVPLKANGEEDFDRIVRPIADEASTLRMLGLDGGEWEESLAERMVETNTVLPTH